MSLVSTVEADLVFVVSKRSVESGKLSELSGLVLVLSFGCGGGLRQVEEKAAGGQNE